MPAKAARADAPVRGATRWPLASMKGAPLRLGRVEHSRSHEPSVFARERYVLGGAEPNEQYQVHLFIHLFDPTCSNAPVRFASTPLATDGAGDGVAQLVIRVEDVPTAVRSATHGARWEVTRGGTVTYRTACAAVALARSAEAVGDAREPADVDGVHVAEVKHAPSTKLPAQGRNR